MHAASKNSCAYFRENSAAVFDVDPGLPPNEVLESHASSCPYCGAWADEVRSTIDIVSALRNGDEEKEACERVKAIYRSWRSGEVLLPVSSMNEAILDVPQLLLGKSEGEMRRILDETSLSLSSMLKNLVIRRTLELGSQDPRGAALMGRVAVFLCEDPDFQERDVGCAPQVRRRQALANAALGNAMRICSDFPAALECFRRAIDLLDKSDFDSVEWARIEQLRAHLFADCQRFGDAERCLRNAQKIYSARKANHMQGRTLIALGSMLGRSGDARLAVDLLRQGMQLTDIGREHRLELVAKHNLVHYLFDLGNFDEALDLLAETRALHAELGNAVDLARLKWLEGQIALEQDNLEQAESAFQEVRAFFARKGVAHDTALVSLDLATVYLKQRRLTELKTLAVEMLTIFEGIGTRKESQAALGFFEKAIEMEKAQMEMVGDLLEYLTALRLEERLGARLSVPT